MRIVKESITKTYREKDIFVEITKQFVYPTEEERQKHCKLMEENGYEDSGQVRRNVGTIAQPEYEVFASFYKCEVEKVPSPSEDTVTKASSFE